jgi:hypothetical protein
MTTVGYISDTKAIIQASCLLFQCDCGGSLKSSERPPLPPALSAKNHPGGQTEILNIPQL